MFFSPLSNEPCLVTGHAEISSLFFGAQTELKSRFLSLLQLWEYSTQNRITDCALDFERKPLRLPLLGVCQSCPNRPPHPTTPYPAPILLAAASEGKCRRWELFRWKQSFCNGPASSGTNWAFTVVKACFIYVISSRPLVNFSICNANQT